MSAEIKPEPTLLLPEGAIMVHVGPYKTGTSAIQMSLHLQRDDLLHHGVLYPGEEYRLRTPGRALMRATSPRPSRAPIDAWQAVVDEVRATDARRVCLSTESFAGAGPQAVARLVDDLGADRVHMVAAVRRLDKLLPSDWQQRVRGHGEVRSYEEFLRRHLVPADRRPSMPVVRRFWNAQDPARLLERWGKVLPPEQMTLIVSDERDRRQLHRTFEAMLGLPRELLQLAPHDNASFTAERVELQRRVNQLFQGSDWSEEDRRRFVRSGFTKGMDRVERGPEETRIPPLPTWARERVAELSAERAETVRTAGVRVVGDPDWLLADSSDAQEGPTAFPEAVSFAPLVGGLEGIVKAVQAERRRRKRGMRRRVERAADPERVLATLSSRQLLAELARRGRARMPRP